MAMTNYEQSLRKVLDRVYQFTPSLVALYLLPAVLVAAGMGVRAWAGAGPAAVVALVDVVIALGVVTWHSGRDLRQVDWDSAPEYERTLNLPSQAEFLIARAVATIRRRLNVSRVHVFRNTCPHTAECGCTQPISAAILPGRHHPLLIVGDRILNNPIQLEFALAHELHHITPLRLRSQKLVRAAMLDGWLIVGLLIPPAWLPAAALAWWTFLLAWRWTDEIACDMAAARTHGAGAESLFHDMKATAARQSRKRRIARTLVSLHPPLWLRRAYCRRLYRQPAAATT